MRLKYDGSLQRDINFDEMKFSPDATWCSPLGNQIPVAQAEAVEGFAEAVATRDVAVAFRSVMIVVDMLAIQALAAFVLCKRY
jgi:hypothetical protein